MSADVSYWSERHALTCERLDAALHQRERSDRARAVWSVGRMELLRPMTQHPTLFRGSWVTLYNVGEDGLGYGEVRPEWLRLVTDRTPTLEAVLYSRARVVLLPAGLILAMRVVTDRTERSAPYWPWITERMTREEYERARTLLKLGGESAARDYLRAAAGM